MRNQLMPNGVNPQTKQAVKKLTHDALPNLGWSDFSNQTLINAYTCLVTECYRTTLS